MRRFLFMIWILLLASIPLGAQTNLEAGDNPVALPILNTSTESADHTTVAVTDDGDILVTWCEQVVVSKGTATNVNTVQTVALFIPTRLEGGVTRQWKIESDNSKTELIGDPKYGDTANCVTTCDKPHPRAVGDNFIVVYPRSRDNCSPARTKVNSVAVEVVDSLSTSTYNTANYYYDGSDGLGYDVSGAYSSFSNGFVEGKSGGNVGIAHYGGNGGLSSSNGAAVVFLDQPSSDGLYDLYAVYVDYDSAGISGTPGLQKLASGALITGVESDDNTASGVAEDLRVAPFVVEEDDNFLVLAYGEWSDASPDVGQISMETFDYNTTSTYLESKDTHTLQGADTAWHHRRPIFGTTNLDDFGVAFTTYDSTGLGSASKVEWMKFSVNSSGVLTEESDYDPMMDSGLTNVEHARAIYAKNGSGSNDIFEALLLRHLNASSPSEQIKYWNYETDGVTRVDQAASTSSADRPAYAVWENSSTGEYYLIVLYDEFDTNGDPRPYIKIIDIS